MRASRTEVLALAHPPFASDVICRDPPDDHRLYANQDKGYIPRCYQLLQSRHVAAVWKVL
jgi:hypothetical protein